ncbi:TrfB-related DNA-binding protein (plasmid) [Acinetobacter sp. ESL0695]|uniref:TrfB-related DNA-binding protein n=1 Tax=Acinetobacter sp. ESL0695 TaxID=2983215 RepID=UPI0023F3F585|nr:TrfB-related DNA-binding protein [Acinetobacter sp. ESL0695]WEV50240.1 TrfB-related DNA-binding protein [Acinetobacter sp. ESL0695]
MAGKSKYIAIFSEDIWKEHQVTLSNLSSDRVNAAKEVMVNGMSPSDVAKKYNRSRQWLTEVLSKVYSKIHETPPVGWERVNVIVPPELAKSIRAMADKALKHTKKNI